MDAVLYTLVALVGAGSVVSARVVKQIEPGVVFRLGRAQQKLRRPGLTMLIPIVDECIGSTCRWSPCPCLRRTAAPGTT